MRIVIQRVARASVTIDGRVAGEIGPGMLVLLGVSVADSEADADQLVGKALNLRIFADESQKMNLSFLDVGGEMLIVSQFTLYADTRRGRRPSFIQAAGGEKARGLYEYFVAKARASIAKVETGEFGAMMDVELVNDGPVTIIIESDIRK